MAFTSALRKPPDAPPLFDTTYRKLAGGNSSIPVDIGGIVQEELTITPDIR